MFTLKTMVTILEKQNQAIRDGIGIAGMVFTLVLAVPVLAQVLTTNTITNIQPISIKSSTTDLQPAGVWHDLQMADVAIQGKNTIKLTGNYEAITNTDTYSGTEVVATLEEYEPVTFDPLLPFGYRVAREVVREVSGYNPVPWQTDSTPCITASGKDICEAEHAVIAANWLKFGTKVMIPEYFGDTVFTVEDRMNTRYPTNVDVLFYDLDEAKRLGRRSLLIQVLEPVGVQIASR